MGAAGNKKPKGMKKKHEASYMAEETNQEISLKREEKIERGLKESVNRI